jgi:hypothetical protein
MSRPAVVSRHPLSTMPTLCVRLLEGGHSCKKLHPSLTFRTLVQAEIIMKRFGVSMYDKKGAETPGVILQYLALRETTSPGC